VTRTVADDPQEQRVINDIQTYGWHSVHIAAEDELPPFSFTDFPLYQIVWPSRDNRMPWDPEVSDSFRAMQPVLGDVPEHT
jgi:hypothetical protein